MKIRYLRMAGVELEDALTWYFERSPETAHRFEQELSVTEKLVQRHPKIGTPSQDKVRSMPVHGYPYSLVYADKVGEIIVVAVMHHSRCPGYWRKRLQQIPK